MLWRRRPELHMSARLWTNLSDGLQERTEGHHESGAFLLGHVDGQRRHVNEIVYYDDLNARAYDSGVVVLRAESFGPLWNRCAEAGLSVVADAHVHPDGAFQSRADRENPMIAQRGHIALIIPDFARPPIAAEAIGMFEYMGRHRWRELGHQRTRRSLKIGI